MGENADADTVTSETVTTEVKADDAKQPSAPSSSAVKDEPKATISIVRDVVAARTKQPESTSESSTDAEKDGEKAADPEAKADDAAEDFSDVPFHKHPRWKQMVTERNNARSEAKQLRTPAENFYKVVQHVKSVGLTNEEAADAIAIFGLAKSNPTEALNKVRPWLEKLAMDAGELLPDDLAKRVKDGEITPAIAVELSRARAITKSTELRSEADRKRDAEERAKKLDQDRCDAAVAWEEDRQKKDPNFKAKQQLIQMAIDSIQRRDGVPGTVEGVRKQLDAAYKRANELYHPPVEKKPVVTPVTSVGTTAAATTDLQAPKSTLDIVKARIAARNSRAA